ncbi:MAG: FixH family protein [Sulfuricurvum sp.]|uniref:FixH family protein n=1 Tax=Sulfuricurvum sp. TaxID=2025608 RepID=UPI00262AFF46|nr:FixH family protein [Sulfuricurvum sp.]MDD2369926.1 FixH family protein [Sulfuricurvum sp.]MDD2949848.1 FixH family protein [Sulfuricurvum sp.]MDD5117258.1 FixH family protein [Sulfuricurvum sp.]
MFKNPGTKWPIIIALAIAGVIGMSVVTLKIAANNPVEMSNFEMHSYHDYDHGINDIIEAKIAFDKKYNIAFLTPQISEKGTVIEYKVTDKSGNAVNDAKVEAVLMRPDVNQHDINLTNPVVSEGRYAFNPVDLPKAGRWDITAKVTVGADSRYYNLKADTRYPNTFEF